MAKYVYKREDSGAVPAPALPQPAGSPVAKDAPALERPAPENTAAGQAHSPGGPGRRTGRLLRVAVCLACAALLPGAFALRAFGGGPGLPGGAGQAAEGPVASLETAGPAAAWAALETQRLDTRPIVVLDAGHGGTDPGAPSFDGSVYEVEANVEMVQRVAALLGRHESELRLEYSIEPGGYDTALGRANTASRLRASLMLSLHLNADTTQASRGFSCFPTPPGRVYHSDSLRFGRLLAQQVSASTSLPVAGSSGIFYIYYVPAAGGGFYKDIVDEADQAEPRIEESFGVVEYPGCPAVLIEQWYISNPQDMALMYNDDGMDAMARCIYRAVCEYFGLAPMP